MLVSQLINANGNPNANQFVISDDGYVAFQSYESRVCEITRDENLNRVVKFGCDWDYSRTTMKHLAEFLRQNGLYELASSQAIRKAINKGYIKDGRVKVIYDETMI